MLFMQDRVLLEFSNLPCVHDGLLRVLQRHGVHRMQHGILPGGKLVSRLLLGRRTL